MLRFIGFYDYTVILTYMSLCSAVLGMVKASEGCFTAAVLCLMASGFCDAFDGAVARTKKNRTEDEKAFGIQLDSLCDVVSFGVFPALLSYHMGADGIVGVLCMMAYVLCAVIRLGFFNVLEANRQKTEGGCNKAYRGMPVTTISMIYPLVYGFRFLLKPAAFTAVLCMTLALSAFLFILDFSVKKPNFQALLAGKK